MYPPKNGLPLYKLLGAISKTFFFIHCAPLPIYWNLHLLFKVLLKFLKDFCRKQKTKDFNSHLQNTLLEFFARHGNDMSKNLHEKIILLSQKCEWQTITGSGIGKNTC